MFSYLRELSMPNCFHRSNLNCAELPLVEAADVDQQHFGRADHAGLLVDELPPAVDDAHAELLLDLAEAGGQRRAVELVEAGIEHLAVGAEALLAAVSIGQNGPDEDVPVDGIEVDGAGEEALEHRSNAADLLDRLVGDVDNSLHK